MEFEFTGRKVEIDPRLEKLTRKEMSKLDKILDRAPAHAHVILSSEKHRQCAEIVLYWRDNVFSGKAENNDLSQSIVSAAGKVEKQVMRSKQKFQSRKRKRVAAQESGPEAAAAEASRIIPARRYRVKPMTPEEAATLIQDSQEQFMVFRDSENGKPSVLYKRKDGNFGLIQL